MIGLSVLISYLLASGVFSNSASNDTINSEALISKYAELWNSEKSKPPLWVLGANPGETLVIPGVTFSTESQPKAGMEILINAELIIINKAMKQESIISTFLHEYGHALYRVKHRKNFNEGDSEYEAMKFSIITLHQEGLDQIAKSEISALIEMAKNEPYKLGVEKLKREKIWKDILNASSTAK